MAKQASQKRAPATRKAPARTMQVMKAEPMKMEPSHDAISKRAFELFESRGGFEGSDMNDWFMAERELRSA
jgi:hypothetical protein